jgi:L-asparaginase
MISLKDTPRNEKPTDPGKRPRVTLLACGGTIATVKEEDQPSRYLSAGELLGMVKDAADIARVEARDVISKQSQLMSLEDLAQVARAAVDSARETDSGVVVTFGTDIMEEVAYLTDLWHEGAPPIVFTGAQRNAGDPNGDGPGNLRDSLRVATSSQARGAGVVVCFAGQVFAASRVRKVDTIALNAYDAQGAVLGRVSGGEVRLYGRTDRPAAIKPCLLGRGVYLIRLCAAVDGMLIRAAVKEGAKAVVVEAFGAGTATEDVIAAIAEATRQGVLAVFVSRCERGGLWALPGPGGYADLLAAGALPLQESDGCKARIRLMALLGACEGDLPALRARLVAS